MKNRNVTKPRYVDYDMLITKLEARYRVHTTNQKYNKHIGADDFAQGIQSAIDAIDKLPIYVQSSENELQELPVLVGTWERNGRLIRCSNCNAFAPTYEHGQGTRETKFCPECGAKMKNGR